MAESSSKEQARPSTEVSPHGSVAGGDARVGANGSADPRLISTLSNDDARASNASVGPTSASSSRRGSRPTPRRFLLGPARVGKRDYVTAPLAFALFVAALVVVAVARGLLLRTLLPVALTFAAIALVLRARRARREARERVASAAHPTLPDPEPSTEARTIETAPQKGVLSLRSRREPTRRFEGVDPTADTLAPPPLRSDRVSGVPGRADRCLEIDDQALALADGMSRTALLEFGTPFGMTLLSNRQRDRVVLALTSKGGSFLVGGRIASSERRGAIRLLSRATVISTDEVAFDAIGPDGLSIELSGPDLGALFESLAEVDPAANDRLLLSDSTGSPLELDGETLVVRGQLFDLTRPLEWKPLLFQESFGQSLALYQATWIRQGSSEVVLVSLLPPSVLDPNPLDFEAAGIPDLDVRAMRDQRLMQATAGTPPPNDLRVAIDGIYMLPLRVALDAAPRPSVLPASVRPA